MSNNGEERTDILVLVDDEGNEHDFALVDRFQVDLNEYAILVPVLYSDESEDDEYLDFEDDAYIFRIEQGEDEEFLAEVEDETEWNKVAALWEERIISIDNKDDEEFS